MIRAFDFVQRRDAVTDLCHDVQFGPERAQCLCKLFAQQRFVFGNDGAGTGHGGSDVAACGAYAGVVTFHHRTERMRVAGPGGWHGHPRGNPGPAPVCASDRAGRRAHTGGHHGLSDARCNHRDARGFELGDCQVETEHLKRFGAREIPRAEFLGRLRNAMATPAVRGRWTMEGAR